MVNLFLCSFISYLENRLLPNDLIIVRNHGDDEKDVWYIKGVLKSPREVHNKLENQPNSELVEIQSNSEF
jgi:hypothetical protein